VSSVVVVAGRRIDAPGAPERFPARNRDLVCARIADRLRAIGATTVVASAACGADLLALQAARALGLRARVVLPFDAPRFRETSVVDRPGDFGPVFDDVCSAAGADVVVLGGAWEGDEAYAAVNRALLDEAAALAGETDRGEATALLVWEGTPRGEGDLTADLANGARARGWAVETVATL
jgi:hypothetical protein